MEKFTLMTFGEFSFFFFAKYRNCQACNDEKEVAVGEAKSKNSNNPRGNNNHNSKTTVAKVIITREY